MKNPGCGNTPGPVRLPRQPDAFGKGLGARPIRHAGCRNHAVSNTANGSRSLHSDFFH